MNVLEGILNPIEWDETGNPVKFSVYTYDEEDYIVENYSKPKKLKKLLSKRVQAKGKLGLNTYGEKVIYATQIKAVKSSMCPPTARGYENNLWEDAFVAHLPQENVYTQTTESYWEAS